MLCLCDVVFNHHIDGDQMARVYVLVLIVSDSSSIYCPTGMLLEEPCGLVVPQSSLRIYFPRLA